MLDRVVIIGAGLAGLNAAYQLKKRGIPFCVLEASGSYGGRIRTLYHYNADDQYVDVGGRVLEGEHQDVFSLCKELGLKIFELGDVAQKPEQLVWVKGRAIELKKILHELVPFFRKVSQLRSQFFEPSNSAGSIFRSIDGLHNYDRISVDDLLIELQRQMSPDLKNAVLQAVTSQFGIDPQNLSALQFLYQFDENSSEMPFQRGQPFGIEGGSSALTQKLFDRSDSIVKDFNFKFYHRCTSINRRGSAFQLNFETDSGSRAFVTKNVIFALPSSQLKSIIGWSEVGLDENLRSAIRNVSLSLSTQLIYKTNSKLWERKFPRLHEGKVFGDFSAQSGESHSTNQSGNSAIYAFQIGGHKTTQQIAQMIPESGRFLGQVFQSTSKDKIEFSDLVSWTDRPFIQGYRTVYAPGFFLQNAELWKKFNVKGLHFVGEYVEPKWLGTMQGAVVSSNQVVEQIAATMREVKSVL
jgi:monoamine oxidase